MGHRVDRDVQRELLAVLDGDPLAGVAAVLLAEGAAEAVLAEDGDERPLQEEALEVDVAALVQAADPLDPVRGAVDRVVVAEPPDRLAGEEAAELAAPGAGELGIGAAARG